MKKLSTNDYVEVKEFIEILYEIVKENKNKDYPKLTTREAIFLTDLLLNRKSKDFILFSIADYLAENYHKGVSTFANGASYRRLQFFKCFISSRGNATKATISAGYSPKSAKQQGYRLLRWIQNSKEKSLSGFLL